MTTWKHKGIEIEFDVVKAKFIATVGKKTVTAPSLDAIKKKIDAGTSFQVWPCYFEVTGWECDRLNDPVAVLKGLHTGKRALVEGRVTGIEKVKGRSYGGDQWQITYKDPNGKEISRQEHAVFPATPEALAAWKLHWETRDAMQEAEHQLEEANKAKLTPLHAAMPYRRAKDEG